MYELLTGLGLAMPAGLNAYIPLLAVAIADRYFGLIHLNAPYDVISSPWGIAVLTVLLVIEILADKIPMVDHVNDLVQSVIRPAAGAIVLMASTDAVSYMNPVVAMMLGLVAGGGVHTLKAIVRPIITATTGGIGNPIVSAAEDGTAIGLSIVALIAPVVIIGVLLIELAVIVYLIRRRRQAQPRRSHAGL